MSKTPIKIGEFQYLHRNLPELVFIWLEVNLLRCYKFPTSNTSKFIIDGGGHIGISSLWFSKIYPNSQILTFEPNPTTFKLLKKNIELNQVSNIKVVNAALTDKKSTMELHTSGDSENSWGMSDSLFVNNLFIDKKAKSRTVKVKTVTLLDYIDQPVSLLKLDVEGAEGLVLNSIKSKLDLIENIFFEFHNLPGSENNNLIQTIKMLKKSGFKVQIYRFSKLFPIRLDLVPSSDRFFTLFICASRV